MALPRGGPRLLQPSRGGLVDGRPHPLGVGRRRAADGDWNRRLAPGAIHHNDHGSTYTSWAFGHRLREAGLLGSMGSIGDCFDNSVAGCFFATLQTEVLDRSTWPSRAGLANAIFAFIEGFYNPVRWHSTLRYLSPAAYETKYQQEMPAGPPTETAA